MKQENDQSPLPMLTRLILVRHGETDHNAGNIVQGQTPGRLSTNGLAQAESAAARLKGMKIDSLYSSDLERARATAGIIARQLPALVHREDERLREQNFGVFEGRPITELLEKMHGEKRDFATFVPVEGESRAEFQCRILGFLEEMRTRHAGETVLVVTHYGVINILLGWLLDHDDPLAADWRIANASVSILDLDENGQAEPHILNDIDHLDERLPGGLDGAL